MNEQWTPTRLTTTDAISRRLGITLLVAYAAATLALAIHHEPWRDEADSWLFVNHAPLQELFHWTRYVGTPALWQLLLEPLAALHLPYFSQMLLHLALAWASAAVVVFLAPFTRLTKVLFLASFYPIYEYSVIARSYVLTGLLLFLAAAFYARRYDRPLRYAAAVALLFNANVHGAFIAAILVALFAMKMPLNRRQVLAIAIMLAGAVAAFLQLRTPAGAAFPHILRNNNPDGPLLMIAWAFLPTSGIYWGFAVGLIVLAILALALREHRDALLLLIGATVLLALLYRFVWFAGYHHSGILFLVAIAAIWIAHPVESTRLEATAALLLNASLLFSVIATIPIERDEVRFAFSASKEMGEYIRDHHLDRFEIAGHKPYHSEALLPYLPGKEFWYPAIHDYGSYMQWNRTLHESDSMSYERAAADARDFFAAQHKPWLLLLNAKMTFPEKRGFRLIYATQSRVFWPDDENYWLYEPLR